MACRSILGQFLRITPHKLYINPKCLPSIKCYSQETRITTQDGQMKEDGDIALNPFASVHEPQKNFIEDLRPPLKRSFNFAAYVNDSNTLQQLIKLGVSLYDIENTNTSAAQFLVKLDFEQDCVPYISFLIDNGLKDKNLGRFISEYPSIFQEPLFELELRIDYLKSKGFTERQISKALNRSCHIISNNVKTLDHKLQQLQIEFVLPTNTLRNMVSKYPPIISIPVAQYKLTNISITQEFGFRTHELHVILEEQPQVIDILRPILLERLDLIHNIIGLSHSTIAKFPKLITGPRFEIKHRFEYLRKLRRNQFNPQEPLYIPPSALYNHSDEEFCAKFAKTSLDDYKLFLKSC